MATPTYDLLDSTTLTSSASSVTFSSISQDYRDLVLVTASTNGLQNSYIRPNGDTGNNVTWVFMQGNGSSATSNTDTFSGFEAFYSRANGAMSIVEIMDYSATDKHKTALGKRVEPENLVRYWAGRWANTAAITSLEIFSSSATPIPAGATFYLFGIAS